MSISIRSEQTGDIPAIAALANFADRDDKRSGPRHDAIINGLREDGNLWLSLVAENMDQAIVGHIALSDVTMPGGTSGWYAVASISVMTAKQSTGIGGGLVKAAIAAAREADAKGLVVIGPPRMSARFGWAPDPRLTVDGVAEDKFQIFPFSDPVPEGVVTYPPAFGHGQNG